MKRKYGENGRKETKISYLINLFYVGMLLKYMVPETFFENITR